MLCLVVSGKLARRKAQLLKEKRIRLLEEAYARKLQTRYRAHIAKKKVYMQTCINKCFTEFLL